MSPNRFLPPIFKKPASTRIKFAAAKRSDDNGGKDKPIIKKINRGEFDCTLCDRIFHYPAALVSHYETEHKKVFEGKFFHKCLCGKRYLDRAEYSQHKIVCIYKKGESKSAGNSRRKNERRKGDHRRQKWRSNPVTQETSSSPTGDFGPESTNLMVLMIFISFFFVQTALAHPLPGITNKKRLMF